MAKLASDYVNLTRICEFTRRLHQLHRLGGGAKGGQAGGAGGERQAQQWKRQGQQWMKESGLHASSSWVLRLQR